MRYHIRIIAHLLILTSSASSSFVIPSRAARPLARRTVMADQAWGNARMADQEASPPKPQHECKFCSSVFESRNKLFRHVRNDPECSKRSGQRMMAPIAQKCTLAIQFLYYDSSSFGSISSHDCGGRLREALIKSALVSTAGAEVSLVSSTQVTVPKHRTATALLKQEDGCFAAADVIVVSLSLPQVPDDAFLKKWMESTNQGLLKNTGRLQLLQINAMKLVPRRDKFHAETSCTQRVYHYIMPITWIPDGELIQKWWLESAIQDGNSEHTNRASTRPPSNALRLFKDILKKAASLDTSQLPPDSKVSAGRFGALGQKERRAMHNFASPELQGDASPNMESIWRVLDRAQMVQFLTCADRVYCVLEFRGDDFVLQQVRRMVATAVAMSHSWLSGDSFWSQAQDASRMIETPLAPAGRLYLADARFHFDELNCGGRPIFESNSIISGESPIKKLQQRIMKDCQRAEIIKEEAKWLTELKTVVAPRIRKQLEGTQQGALPSSATMSSPPASYDRTLALLRQIVASEQWPETSVARYSVIQSDAKLLEKQNGSFSVVNPLFESIEKIPSPLANERFPELTEAVFELELALARDINDSTARPASSHCAINCNAQFTPHVDSGRGSGQSLSMIVGLGDYAGGQLAVESEEHCIRYIPLEFDGWRLRHWTLPFEGERFSLVWFTPRM